MPKKHHAYSNIKVAVVGSGPAGLSCAYYLALDGYSVTVFEKEQQLGGMLTLGVPAFRLEKDIIDAEIAIIRELGVEFKTGVEVGKDVSLDALRKQGYAAFYVAIGAQGGRALGVEGEDATGVVSGIEFLRRVNAGENAKLSGKTVVIGGGNVAVDVARTAIRSGASEVTMVCLESRKEMPPPRRRLRRPRKSRFRSTTAGVPKRILSENGKVTGVEFKRCTAVFNAEGRFAPQSDENDTIVVPADAVLVTIGQSILWGDLLAGCDAVTNRNGTLQADGFTYQSALKDVFTGGDCYTGPKFAIDAIAAGKQAAISIHRYVHPGQSLTIGRDRREYKELDKKNAIVETYDNTPRQKPETLDSKTPATKTFRDLRGTFTEAQVQAETARCLGCGVTLVDQYMCVGCGQCTTKCKFDLVISDIMMPNMDGYEFVRSMRKNGLNMPVLIITAKDTFEDMASGFQAGTDDYMVKPVNVNEMILRINALLKRAQIVNEKKIRFENAELHFDDLTVCIDGDCNVLPQKEFYILYKLLSNPNRVFTKQQIMDEIWGMDTESDLHTLDVHISRLRERFKENAQFEIVTIRGLGYKAVKKHA